jgi:O-antigen/teichoic acid export membrane protein
MAVVIALVFLAPSLANDVSASNVASLRILVAVLGANLVLMPLLSIPDAVLMGSNRAYVSSLIQLLALIVTNVGFVLVAKSGGGIVALGFVVLGGAVLGALLVFGAARSSTPWFSWERSDGKELKRFAGFSGWLLAWAGVEKVLLSGEILLLMALVSAKAATGYVFATFPVQLFLAISLLTVSAATPTIATLMSTSKEKANRLARTLRECVLAASVGAAALLLLLNKSFVGLWVGEATYVGNIANLLIALTMLQVAWIRCDAQLGDLTLDVAGRAKLGLIATALSVLVPIILTFIAGAKIEWVLFGVLLGRLVLNATTGRQIRREFDCDRATLWSWVSVIAMLAVCYWIGAHYAAETWLAFVVISAIAAIVLVPLVFIALVSRDVRKALLTDMKLRTAIAT